VVELAPDFRILKDTAAPDKVGTLPSLFINVADKMGLVSFCFM
jgi:hypothetical protein